MRTPGANARAWGHMWTDRGAVSTEYALLASLIAVVVLAAVVFLGVGVAGLFNDTASSVSDAL